MGVQSGLIMYQHQSLGKRDSALLVGYKVRYPDTNNRSAASSVTLR